MAAIDTSSTAGLETAEFDFVVVGGGTSGLVVASRLTEDENIRVLVVEAGRNRLGDPKITVPGLGASTYFDPDYDWCITSEPQEHLNGRSLGQPVGKVLGGSSAIDLGMVIYPSKSGFESWEKLGNPGWGWETMAPYFRKFHTFTEPERKELHEELMLDYLVKDAQGDSGPVQVSFGGGDWFPPFSKAWPRAFKTLNQELTGDPIFGLASGAFSNPATIHPVTKERSHAASAYYHDRAQGRPNLHVLTEALVEKVLLEKQPDGTVKASGVQFIAKDGQRRRTLVNHEVVLAAGALKTPQLLELSGIGSTGLLAQHGIECLVDNANVGENLQDHGFVPFSWEVQDPLTSGDQLRDSAVQQAAMSAYQSAAAGPLSICPLSSSFLPLFNQDLSQTPLADLLSRHVDDPSLPTHLRVQYDVLRAQLSSPDDTSGQYTLAPFQLLPDAGPSPTGVFGMSAPGFYASIVSVLNHPFSRGRIHNGGRAVETLEEAREAVKNGYIPHYHVCGTAAMMPRETGGVVDARLRVYGTRGLRVVDASVFPLIPRGNIQSDVYAVAERAADVLKEEWRERRQ